MVANAVNMLGGGGGWVQPVVGILFAIIFISVIIGVAYVLLVNTQSSLQGVSNRFNTYSTATTNSVAATNLNTYSSGNLVLSWSGAVWISPTYPATVSITVNTVNALSTDVPAVAATSTASQTLTYTETSNALTVLALTNNVYKITKIAVTGLNPNDTGAIATVTDYYYPYGANSLNIPNYPATTNVLTATGVVTVTQPTVGGQTAIQGYTSVADYISTLVSFIGIIVLLAIIAIVLFVLSLAFGWFGVNGGAQR